MSEVIWTIGYCSRSGDYASASNLYAEIDEEEGFFTSETQAQLRADELNRFTRESWEQENAKAQQQYAEKLEAWEEQQRQIEFLTANGFAPELGSSKPREPKPVAYENWLWGAGGRGTHEVVALKAAKVQQAV